VGFVRFTVVAGGNSVFENRGENNKDQVKKEAICQGEFLFDFCFKYGYIL